MKLVVYIQIHHILNLLLEVRGVWQPSTHTQSSVLQAPPDQNISARERLRKVKLKELPAKKFWVGCFASFGRKYPKWILLWMKKLSEKQKKKKDKIIYMPASWRHSKNNLWETSFSPFFFFFIFQKLFTILVLAGITSQAHMLQNFLQTWRISFLQKASLWERGLLRARTEFATLLGQWSTIKATYHVLVFSFHSATNIRGNCIVSFLGWE